jgi:hypothetical protein
VVALACEAAVSRKRPTEVKLVSKLLSYEAESVDEMAEAVIHALDEDRRKRDSYVIKAEVGGEVYGIGPYTTRGDAERVAVALRPDLEPDVVKGAVVRLIRPAIIEDDMSGNVGTHCAECGHPTLAHDWPKSKVPGCVVTGCLCGKPTAPPV